jgi:DNA-binding MarR family transcriptional regulator
MPRDRDELALRAWAALKGATWAIMAGIGDQRPPGGASIGHMGFLHALSEEGGAVTPGQLARRIGLTPATVTGAVNGMEELGLITRDRDPDDRRGVRVALTDAGRAAQREWGQRVKAHVRNRLTALSDRELGEIAKILTKVAPPIHGPPRDLLTSLRHRGNVKSAPTRRR